MPKIKTNRGAAKRFKKTAGGFKRAQSHPDQEEHQAEASFALTVDPSQV